jgi:hypothetical protein
MKLTSIL